MILPPLVFPGPTNFQTLKKPQHLRRLGRLLRRIERILRLHRPQSAKPQGFRSDETDPRIRQLRQQRRIPGRNAELVHRSRVGS